MSSIRKKLNYANIMASIAVFVTLSGSAYAAVKIDGSNVRDNSLTGRDIRNRSVAAKDLKASAITKATDGQTGPRGPQGVTGATGNTGERGPSNGVLMSGKSSIQVGGTTQAGFIELPAGNWVLSVSMFYDNNLTVPNRGSCFLNGPNAINVASSGNVPLDADDNAGTTDLDAEAVAINGAVELDAPAGLSLSCHAEVGTIRVNRPVITAIQVESLDDQSVIGPIT